MRYSFGTLYEFFRYKPYYLLCALGIGIVLYILLFWINNIGLLGHILSTPSIPPTIKLQLLSGTFTSIGTHSGSWILAVVLVMSILQGFIISALGFMIRRQHNINKAAGAVGQTGLAGLFAAAGLGCSACGTSVLTPLLSTLGATASHSVSLVLGKVAILASLIITVGALYVVGKRLSMYSVSYKPTA